MKWQNVYVFISSTFNDMHAERDYLVKNVFPELSEWCEARKLHLVDIDLRWGVTSADSKAKNTVLACLKNIDECRPFFLCLLGQRRGWVPTQDDIGVTTIKNYPGLSPYIGKNSVTEMEIEHALLSPMHRLIDEVEAIPAPVDHALFFFRNDNFTSLLTDAQKKIYTNAAELDEAAADHELKSFKDKVRYYKGSNVTDYDCRWEKSIITTELLTENADAAQGRLVNFIANGKPLKNAIIDGLKAEIEKEFPDNNTISAMQTVLEADLEQQAYFIEQNRNGFIPRDGDFDKLNEYIDGSHNSLFLLTAPAGLGKTMLLANYTNWLINKKQKVYARFCGASDLVSDTYSLWKSIFEEAHIKSPPTLDELRQDISRLMETLAGGQDRCVIIIDAINQLPNGLDMFAWLPHILPDGLRLIISFKEDEISLPLIEQLKKKGNIRITSIRPFTEDSDKHALISAFLEKYLKALDNEYISVICNLPASENPLYLKIVLSELRVFGAFKQLETEIKHFGNNPLEAFNSILDRLENDTAYSAIEPKKAVPFLFGLLSCARNGLSEDELTSCFRQEFTEISENDIRNAIRLYNRQLRSYLARRNGRTDFLYESFMLAAQKRYSANMQNLHARLAHCFRSYADPNKNFCFEGKTARSFTELTYHMHHSGDNKALESMLCDYLWMYNKTRICGVYALINDYEYIGGDNAEYCMRVIRDSLVLSAHVLQKDCEQLPPQLWGRLADFENKEIKLLLDQAVAIKQQRKEVWLRPKAACMDQPGSALLRIYQTQNLYIPSLTPDKKHLLIINAGSSSMNVIDISTGTVADTYPISKAQKVFYTEDGKNIIYYQFRNPDMFVFNIETKKISILKGLRKEIRSVATRGNILAVSSYDNQLMIWKCNGDEWINVSGEIFFDGEAITLTKNGAKIITGEKDGKIKIWDTDIAKCIFECKPYSEKISHIILLPCETKFYTFADSLGVFHLDTCELIAIITGLIQPQQTVKLSPSGKYIAYHERNNVCVIDTGTENKMELLRYNTAKSYGNDFTFSTDEKQIIIGSEDYSIKIYDLKTQELLRKLTGHAGAVSKVMLSTDERYLISYGGDSTTRVWDMNVYSSSTCSVNETATSIKLCKNKQLVLAGTKEKLMNVFDLKTGKKVKSIKVLGNNCWSITVSKSENFASLCYRFSMEVINLMIGESVCKVSTDMIFDDNSTSLRFIFANFYIENQQKIIFTDRGSIFVYSVETNNIIREIKAHTLTIPFFCVFNHDMNLLTIGSGNEIKNVAYIPGEFPIKIWDLETGECLHTFGELPGTDKSDSLKILCAQLSEDETTLFTLTGCGELKIWDIGSGKLTKTFHMPGSGWFSQICIPGHKQFIIYSADNNHSINVMDLHTNQIIAHFISELTFNQIDINSDGIDIVANGSGILNFLGLENYQ
jgi:WD40 repeat protein